MVTVQISTSDHCVSYDTFLNDLAARVTERVLAARQQPEFMSQRQAYRTFGRANVERWVRQGKIEPSHRVGKVEYRTSELRLLQQAKQDYFR